MDNEEMKKHTAAAMVLQHLIKIARRNHSEDWQDHIDSELFDKLNLAEFETIACTFKVNEEEVDSPFFMNMLEMPPEDEGGIALYCVELNFIDDDWDPEDCKPFLTFTLVDNKKYNYVGLEAFNAEGEHYQIHGTQDYGKKQEVISDLFCELECLKRC